MLVVVEQLQYQRVLVLCGLVDVGQERAQRLQEQRENRDAVRRKVFCKYTKIYHKLCQLGLRLYLPQCVI